MSDQHYVFEVEVPAIYTADLDELRAFSMEGDSESDFLLNCVGEPGVCRLRVENHGEKDSEVVEVWGLIRAARLVEPSVGYEPGPVTDEQLAAHGERLMRDEHACEWCQYREPETRT